MIGGIVVAVTPAPASADGLDLSFLQTLLDDLLHLGQAPANPATPAAAPQNTPPPTGVPINSQVATADGNPVSVYSDSSGSHLVEKVAPFNAMNQPEVFLVIGSAPGWWNVLLPTKPNGSTGWVQDSQVSISTTPYYIKVHQEGFSLELYEYGQLQNTYKVAVGAPSTPTPNGLGYVWASEPYNKAPYAAGIFALSMFSPVLENWPGGGRTGIHGWQDTSVLGSRASHGCVRMSGSDFQNLLNNVPLGTPVEITET